MSRRTLVNLGFFAAVFAVMLVWAVNNIVTIDAITHPYPISGDFQAAAGVRPNSEVAYLGVHFGTVDHVQLLPGGVRIHMQIDRGRKIPEGSVARIFRKSAIGEPYIDFVPPSGYHDDTGPFLASGAEIPLEQTQIPLEFSELLRSASRLVSGIDPEKTHTLVHELALGLAGRGDSLRQLTEAADQLTTTFAAHTDVLDRLATNNTALTHVVTEHRTSLGDSLGNLRALSESLRNAQGDTAVLLDRGSELLTQTADLVGNEKQNLDCLLGDLEDVIDLTTTDGRLAGTETLLQLGPEAFGNVERALDHDADGVWARTNLTAPTDNPATQYAPPGHALPSVPSVPACSSALQPRRAGADFVPPAGLGGPRRPWPLTGALAAGWALAIALAARAGFRLSGPAAATTTRTAQP